MRPRLGNRHNAVPRSHPDLLPATRSTGALGARRRGDSRRRGKWSSHVRAEGKRVAFLCGSPTTNRLDVAVGRKISLLLRLPPANTRSLIARRARFPSHRSIRPPTFRRIARKSVRPRDQMMTHDRIRVLRILIIPSLSLHSCCLFVRQLRGDSSCPRSPFRGATRYAAREIILPDVLRNNLAGCRCDVRI